jgi:hypothetical protein
MPDIKDNKTPVSPPMKRREDFRLEYANNIRFEPTVYDLKMVFGETDLSTGTETVEQHMAVTLPWPFVKVLSYFLQIQLMVQERQNGPVGVPQTQIPPIQEPPPELANDPKVQGIAKDLKKFREDFLASNSK